MIHLIFVVLCTLCVLLNVIYLDGPINVVAFFLCTFVAVFDLYLYLSLGK